MGTEAFMVAVVRVEAILIRCGEMADLEDRLKRDHVGLVTYSTELALRALRGGVQEVRDKLKMFCPSAMKDALIRLWMMRGNDSSGVTWLEKQCQGKRGPDGVWVDGVNGHSLVDFVKFAYRACRETRAVISQQMEIAELEKKV